MWAAGLEHFQQSDADVGIAELVRVMRVTRAQAKVGRRIRLATQVTVGGVAYDVLSDYVVDKADVSSAASEQLAALKVAPGDARSFVRAASEGDTTRVRLFLEAGIDPDTRLDGNTALHEAAAAGYPDIAFMLLEAGADHSADGRSGTPADSAWVAVGSGAGVEDALTVIWLLVVRGGDMTNRTASALAGVAAANGLVPFLVVLVNHPSIGPDRVWEGDTLLQLATAGGHTETVVTLIEAGADVDRVGAPNARRCSERWGPLQIAADLGYQEIVEILIVNSADIDGADASSCGAPLRLAALNRHTAAARSLWEAGASMNGIRGESEIETLEAVAREYQDTGNTDAAREMLSELQSELYPDVQDNILTSAEDFEWRAATDVSSPATYSWTVTVSNQNSVTLDITVRFEFFDESGAVVKAETKTIRLVPSGVETIREESSMPFQEASKVSTFSAVVANWSIVQN